jgi:hypothetical protein
MFHGFNGALDRNLSSLPVQPELKASISEQRSRLGAIEIPPSQEQESRAALRLGVEEAFVAGFRLVTLGSAALALASSLCAWLIIKKRE